MRPETGQVLHFSEDPTMTRFVPRHRDGHPGEPAYVWAVNHDHAPSYWFPRECPRAMTWTAPDSSPEAVERILGPGGGTRLHAIEYAWLERFRTVRLYAYRLPAGMFRPWSPADDHAYVSTRTVVPLGPAEPVGDLFALHEAAGIQLRVLPGLWGLWDAIVASGLPFSGIRLRNAGPRLQVA